jgi:hypothetical protein
MHQKSRAVHPYTLKEPQRHHYHWEDTYFAMTSTYPRPFLRGFIVFAFLVCGAPKRSSIELALLSEGLG